MRGIRGGGSLENLNIKLPSNMILIKLNFTSRCIVYSHHWFSTLIFLKEGKIPSNICSTLICCAIRTVKYIS